MICIFFFVGGWNEIDGGQWLTNGASKRTSHDVRFMHY